MKHALVLLCLLAPGVATAAATAADAAKLGNQLTAIGAEKKASGYAAGNSPAANKAAAADEFAEAQDPPVRVPEWSATTPAVSVTDKPLFTINAVNVGRYREHLTESHFSLLQAYSNTYSMNIYPSKRTVRWPAEIESATKDNATRCTLKGADELSGCRLGFPFPIPQNGAEVIWNHKLRWRGDAVARINDQLVVQPTGKFQVTRLAEDFDFHYANIKGNGRLDSDQREIFRYLSEAMAPPRLAGNVLLIHEKTGTGVSGRVAWALTPGAKRARRETKACCDNPYEGSDGQQFFDQIDMFNGPLDRYAWKLLGKREIFVPYNEVKLQNLGARYDELVRPAHLNPDLLRYELHRVWVVEATLKPGQAHTLRKRRFYVDEDSWSILAVDVLDNYDQPYQFQEAHLAISQSTGRPEYVAETVYHLDTESYFVTGLRDPAAPARNSNFAAGTFEPDALDRRASGKK